MTTPSSNVVESFAHQDLRDVIHTTISTADAYISEFGSPSPEIEKILTRKVRNLACAVGSVGAVRFLESCRLACRRQGTRKTIDDLQEKYLSFSPYFNIKLTNKVEDPRDIQLLIKEGLTYEANATPILNGLQFEIVTYADKVRQAFTRHAQSAPHCSDHIKFYETTRQDLLKLASTDQNLAHAATTFADHVDAGFADGAKETCATQNGIETVVRGINNHHQYVPIMSELVRIIENPANKVGYDAARTSLKHLFMGLYDYRSSEGLDYIESVAHDRNESGAKRIAAQAALTDIQSEHVLGRAIRAFAPKMFHRMITGHPFSAPR